MSTGPQKRALRVFYLETINLIKKKTDLALNKMFFHTIAFTTHLQVWTSNFCEYAESDSFLKSMEHCCKSRRRKLQPPCLKIVDFLGRTHPAA